MDLELNPAISCVVNPCLRARRIDLTKSSPACGTIIRRVAPHRAAGSAGIRALVERARRRCKKGERNTFAFGFEHIN